MLMSCVEQYFCSKSAASLVSSHTVLLLRAHIMLHHVGGGGLLRADRAGPVAQAMAGPIYETFQCIHTYRCIRHTPTVFGLFLLQCVC